MGTTEVAKPTNLDFLDLPEGIMIPKRFPYELHWRISPPKWTGNLEQAHGRLYGHLSDQSCCSFCGSVPCPVDHEALKRQRLVDLQFIKDMAKERRLFKEKSEQLMKDIEQWEKRAESWENEKLMLAKSSYQNKQQQTKPSSPASGDNKRMSMLQTQVRELQEKQRRLEQEKLLMEREIDRLRAINDQTLHQLDVLKKNEAKLKLLQLRLDTLYAENEDLKAENAKFRKMIVNQENEIVRLGKENNELNCDLTQAKQAVRSLKVQVDQYLEDVQTLQGQMAEKDSKIKDLNQQLTFIIEELAEKTRIFQEKELESEQLMAILRIEIKTLNDRVAQSDEKSKDLERRLIEALREIEILRKKLANNSRFRKYVEVKREVIDLRDKHEILVNRFSEELKPVLPVMKHSGRVLTSGLKTPGLDLPTERPRSAGRTGSFSDLSVSSNNSSDYIG